MAIVSMAVKEYLVIIGLRLMTVNIKVTHSLFTSTEHASLHNYAQKYSTALSPSASASLRGRSSAPSLHRDFPGHHRAAVDFTVQRSRPLRRRQGREPAGKPDGFPAGLIGFPSGRDGKAARLDTTPGPSRFLHQKSSPHGPGGRQEEFKEFIIGNPLTPYRHVTT